MRTLITALCLGLSTAGVANDNHIVGQIGFARAKAAADNALALNGNLPAYGLRYGRALSDNLDLVVGVQGGMRTATRLDGETSDIVLRSAYSASTLQAGVRGKVALTDYLHPYAMTALVGHVGHLRLDDDPNRRDHPGQLRSTVISGGLTARGGVELRFRNPDRAIIPLTQIELGWQGVLQHTHRIDGEALMRMGYSGFAFQIAAGAAF